MVNFISTTGPETDGQNGTLTAETPPSEVADSPAPTQPLANGTESDNLDKIRDILFGQQVSSQTQRFEQIEQRLTKSYDTLHQELHQRLDTIENMLTTRLDQLEARLGADEAKQNSNHKSLQASVETVNQRLEESTAAIAERSRQHVEERAHTLSEQAKQQATRYEQGLQLVAESAQRNRQAIADHGAKLQAHDETLNTQAIAFHTHEEQLKGTLQILRSEASQQTNNLKEAVEQQIQSCNAELKKEVLLRKQSEQLKREQLGSLVEGLAHQLREGLPSDA